MAEKLLSRNLDVATYPALFRRVKETLLDGQKRIEQEKVRTYWETGKLIQTHILKNKDRADYGAEVVLRLAEDLAVSRPVLTRCIQFFLKYPRFSIGAVPHQLGWAHYQELLSIPDDKKRAQFEQIIIKGELSIDEVRARKRASHDDVPEVKVSAVSRPLSAALAPIKGTLYTYQIMKRRVLTAGVGELVVDLGFSTVHNVEAKVLANFSAGDIVASVPKEDAYRFSKVTREDRAQGIGPSLGATNLSALNSKPSRITDLLYTYKALVEKVVDADTLKVHIDLGFDTWVRQTLRLRGIDSPEVGTKDGDQAKAFVQSLLKEADEITIRSSRSDKYDRYLADVFITSPTPGVEEVFLNGLLLEKGLAERVV